MKFSVKGNVLVSGLSKVIGVTPTRSTLPILGNIYFSLHGNQLTLIGTDLEVYVKVELKVDGKQDGQVAIPAKKLETLIMNLSDRDLSFETGNNFKLVIKTKGGRWTLTGEDPEDFQLAPDIEDANKFDVDGSLLNRYVSKAVHAASTDELRRNMNGVYFEMKSGELKVVATDGHRLVRIIKSDFDYKGEKLTMLVPVKTCTLITKLLRAGNKVIDLKKDDAVEEPKSDELEMTDNSKTELYFSNDFLKCQFNNVTVTSRLIDDTFPNYESVIPTDNEKILKVERSELVSSVKRCIILSDQITNRTSLSVADSELKVKSANNEYGTDSEEVIECNFTETEEFEIAFNGKYLLDALQQFDTKEILFDLNSPLKAAVLRPTEQEEGEDMMMLVMPVRNI